jgi:glycosyltransferase involved in cell wall biosynthesis
MTLVSVIIPAYNQGCYLGQAIKSVLDQSYHNLEVIVVDDGSTDDTQQVVKGFCDDRVHYIHQENRGLSGARNTGIRASKGNFLSYLDADDEFLPEALALLTYVLTKSPQIGLVAGQSIRIDDNGHSLGEKVIGRIPKDLTRLLLHNPVQVCNVLVRREWMDQVGFFDESLRAYEDWDLWLRLAKAGCPMISIENTVALYRVHDSQMTLEVERMRQATFTVLDKIYNDPCLPESWEALKDKAYSRAYLRSAGSALRIDQFSDVMTYLSEAVRLDPDLLANDAKPLARRFSAWTDDPRIINKLGYLESLYENLPKNLMIMKHRKHRDLSQAAMRIAYQAYGRGDRVTARLAVLQAFRYKPQWLFNRGAISIFVRSWLNPLIGRRE